MGNSGTNAFTAANGVLANDNAPDGGLSVVGFVVGGNTFLTLATGNGYASIRSDGSFDYTPAQGFSGTERLTYRVRDANGSVDDATLTITVSPGAGGNPVDAVDDSYTVARNAPATVFGGAQGVLANDTGADGGLEVVGFVSGSQPIPQRSVFTPSGGSAVVEANGQLTYQPATGFTGTETLTYRLRDADGSTDDATITITVGSGSGNPVDAVDDAYRTARGVPLLVAAARGLLANGSAPDGGAAADAGSFSTTQGGSVTVQASGAFACTPPSGFTGTDSFQYRLTDGDGSADTATATITVAAPTAIAPVRLSDVALGIGGRRITGESSSRLYTSAAGVGDLDGDGRSEILIGAPYVDTYLGASPYRLVRGAAYLLFSRAAITNLNDFNRFIQPGGTTGGFKILSETIGLAGSSVAGAGDVNGDGRPDVIVSTDRTIGLPTEVSPIATVVFGKADTAEVDARVGGTFAGSRIVGTGTTLAYGAAVSSAGDLNGDGLGDLLVSGGAYLQNDAAATYLIYGSASWRT